MKFDLNFLDQYSKCKFFAVKMSLQCEDIFFVVNFMHGARFLVCVLVISCFLFLLTISWLVGLLYSLLVCVESCQLVEYSVWPDI